jgi:hypothetical protein
MEHFTFHGAGSGDARDARRSFPRIALSRSRLAGNRILRGSDLF